MLLYSDIKTEIGGRVVDADDLLTNAWFQRQVWDAYTVVVAHSGGYWLREEGTLTTVASTGSYALAANCWIPVQMIDTTNQHIVDRCDQEDEAHVYINRSNTGLPYSYYRIANAGVSAQPTSASAIAIVSNSASDVTDYTVRVRGLVSGLEYTEVETLTGTVAVSTTAQFTHIYEVNKNLPTNGTVTVTANAGVVTNVTLPLEVKFATFPWIRFVCVPADAYSIRYPYIRKPTNVVQDSDRFEVPEELEECLVMAFEAKARRHYQEFDKAQKMEAENIALIKERTKVFNHKHGSYVKNLSGETQSTDFLQEVYLWNLP